jgi:hypothetical protein
MTTTEGVPGHSAGRAPAAGEPDVPASSSGYEHRVAALTAAYHSTVDHIMTNRYGPGWASRGDLPDDAYTTETVFHRWLSDLLDHIDIAATPTPPSAQDALS